jgi:hypothetical protein
LAELEAGNPVPDGLADAISQSYLILVNAAREIRADDY